MDIKTALVPLIAAACALVAALIRSSAPSKHFFHTKYGLLVLSAASGGLDSVAEAIHQHGLNAVVLIGVVTSTVLAAAFQMNPSIARDGTSKIPFILLAFMAFGTVGCAPTDAYVVALKTKGSVSDALLGAYQAWRAYDAVHQDALIAAAPTAADAAAKLKDWRNNTQEKVDDAFVIAEKAVATYSSALAAAGAARRSDYGVAIADVLSAVGELLSTLKAAGVDVPPALSPTSQADPPTLVADKDTGRVSVLASFHEVVRRGAQRSARAFVDRLCAGALVARAPLCLAAAEVSQ